MSTHSRTVAMVAAATGIQVGLAIVASRYVIDQTTPVTLALLRYGVGFLCLAPVVLITSRSWFRTRDLLPISVLGIFQFGILVALLNHALLYISSAQAALVFATFPLQTMILAAAFGVETLTWKKTMGVFLTISGITIVVGHTLLQNSAPPDAWIGFIAAGLSAFCGAICSICYRPYLQIYPAQNIAALAMLTSVGFLLVISVVEGGLPGVVHISATGYAVILFIGISSALGYFGWLWALKYMSPTRVTMYLSLSPITSAFFGVIFLSETLTFYLTLGTALVISGLLLALRDNPV